MAQITLDDDFIVPDTIDDMEQVVLDTGKIRIETVKNQGDKVAVEGKSGFQVLYRRETDELQILGGDIPLEEVVSVSGLGEKGYVGLNWTPEDLNTDTANPRKLGVQAVIALQVQVETLRDVETVVDVSLETGSREAGPGLSGANASGQVRVEILKRITDVVAIAVRHKDTCRIKKELSLTGGKPNIGQLLWQEMELCDVTVKPLGGRLHPGGELSMFIIYSTEDGSMPMQWLEETMPSSGDMNMNNVKEEQIPMVTVRPAHKNIEAKPNYDGEMREMDVDVVLELGIKFYEEEEAELLNNVYSNSREIRPTRVETCSDQILTRNMCRSRMAEKLKLPRAERILQIRHDGGAIRLDDMEVGEDYLQMGGVSGIILLYLTSDDISPVQSSVGQVPLRYTAEARGIHEDNVYQLDAGPEQLSAVMMGGDTVGVKTVIALDFLVLQPAREPVITRATITPMDLQELQELPDIAGYIVQPDNALQNVVKKLRITVGTITFTNELADGQVKRGQRLLLVKEIARS